MIWKIFKVLASEITSYYKIVISEITTFYFLSCLPSQHSYLLISSDNVICRIRISAVPSVPLFSYYSCL